MTTTVFDAPWDDDDIWWDWTGEHVNDPADVWAEEVEAANGLQNPAQAAAAAARRVRQRADAMRAYQEARARADMAALEQQRAAHQLAAAEAARNAAEMDAAEAALQEAEAARVQAEADAAAAEQWLRESQGMQTAMADATTGGAMTTTGQLTYALDGTVVPSGILSKIAYWPPAQPGETALTRRVILIGKAVVPAWLVFASLGLIILAALALVMWKSLAKKLGYNVSKKGKRRKKKRRAA